MLSSKSIIQRSATRIAAFPPVTGALSRLLGRRRCVFVVHRLRDVEAPGVGHELAAIEATVFALPRFGCDIVSVRDTLADSPGLSRRGRPQVAITVDDGHHDQGLLAERLVAPGVQPAVFVLTDLVSGRDWPCDSKIAWLIQESKVPGFAVRTSVGGDYTNISSADALARFEYRRFSLPDGPLVALRYASGMEWLARLIFK